MLASLIATFALCNFCTSPDRPLHVATTPRDRLGEQWWSDRHRQKIEITMKGAVDLAFLGDSITHSWEGSGKQVWDQYYSRRRAANFGFSGDRTEHVLWRLDHGELIPAKPKVVVMMIGTNNIGHGSASPNQTADGVGAIVDRLRAGIPGVKVLLLAVFPRGLRADDAMRRGVAEASRIFESEADGKDVVYLDIGKHFLRSDGEIRATMVPDALHPNEDGYEIWARAMEPTLSRLLGESPFRPGDST